MEDNSRVGRHTWSRFLTVTRPFFRSEVRGKAWALCGVLLLFLLAVSGLNVVNSYVGRDFMTAVERRNGDVFRTMALMYLGVFAVSTLVAVFYRYTEERLGLLWRDWLTRHLTDRYLADRVYYRLQVKGNVDNPDQRIAEDVRTFTTVTLSLGLVVFNGLITIFAFSGVLWSITPWLVIAAVSYAAVGSVVALWLGRRMVWLNVLKLKQEADLRYDLIRVRDHAEPIAMLGAEADENTRVRGRLGTLMHTLGIIVGVNRNLGFFTTAYGYLIPILPILIVAPQFIAGDLEFGAVTQAAMAFAHVVAAFSLVVNEFQRLSGLTADVERLGAMWEAIEAARTEPAGGIVVAEAHDRVAFEGLTLWAPRGGGVLVSDLNVAVPEGRRLLIQAPAGPDRSALLRAAAGMWKEGRGRIVRPPLDDMMVLPQKPLMVPGTLRDQFRYAVKGPVPDGRIREVVRELGLEALVERVGGLDAERDWPNLLCLGDQQLVAAARVLLDAPRFALLDEAAGALETPRARQLYKALAATDIAYISVAADPGLADFHDQVLEVHDDGTWTLSEPGEDGAERPPGRLRHLMSKPSWT